MKKETDLNQIKSMARTFLYLDIEETKFGAIMVQHPFTNMEMVCLLNGKEPEFVNLLEDENALSRWRDIMKNQIEECEYPHQLYILLNKPYRLAFLKYTAEYMSQDDLSEILADVRTSTESPNLDPNLNKRKLVSLFISSNPYMLMTEEKLEVFNSLDEIMIYRGVTSYNADNEKALSWTLDYDKAEWFAKRFGEARIVYEAQIEEAHILAYFNRKNESEIIVDPEYLLAIEETQTQIGEIAMM